MAVFSMITGILFILLILLIVIVLKGKRLLPKKLQTKLFPIFIGLSVLSALFSALFIAPNIPDHQEVQSKEVQKRLYEYYDVRDIPEEYKVEEWIIDKPEKRYKLELDNLDLDLITFPTFSVEYEVGRKDMTIVRYEKQGQVIGRSIGDSLPSLDLNIEKETIRVMNKEMEPIVERYYEILHDDVMNQFIQDPVKERYEMHYEEPEVYFHIIAPEGVEFKSVGEVLYIDEVDSE